MTLRYHVSGNRLSSIQGISGKRNVYVSALERHLETQIILELEGSLGTFTWQSSFYQEEIEISKTLQEFFRFT